MIAFVAAAAWTAAPHALADWLDDALARTPPPATPVDPVAGDGDLTASRASAEATCTESCNAVNTERADHNGRLDVCATRVPNGMYCEGTARRVVNPYAVARTFLPGATGGAAALSEACRYYLLYKARDQVEPVLSRRGLTEETRSRLEFGRDALGLVGSCGAARVLGLSDTLRSQAGPIIEAAIGAEAGDAERTYCRRVSTGCAAMGGSMRNVGGWTLAEEATDSADADEGAASETRVCVVNGVVVDPSCTSNARYAQNVRTAISNVRNHGISCLDGLGAGDTDGASQAAGHLRNQFQNSDPKTQVCCGHCRNSIFPGGTGGTSADAAAVTRPAFGRAPHGTITLSSGQAAGSSSALNSVLFHEFLHRIGMCRNSDHNYGSYAYPETRPDRWLLNPTDGSCPGVATASGTVPYYPVPNPPGAPLGCLRESEVCPGQPVPPFAPPPGISNYDPVYACESACYGTHGARSGTAANAVARNACVANAARNDFNGRLLSCADSAPRIP